MRKYTQNHIFIPEDPPKGPSTIAIIILLFVFPPVSTCLSFFMMFKRGKREWTRKRYRDFRRYANLIGSRYSVSIRELSTRLGKATADVISDLQSMIDQGFIGGSAYIDRSNMTLVLDSGVVETEFVNPTINVYVNQENERAAETANVENAVHVDPVQTEEENTPKESPRRPTIENEDFEEKLREIRHLNDEIENGLVSYRIDRIGELTASIFRVVREKPERADEVRKFMNYYLPTTFKLLKTYSLMEKQSYQGENIIASRKKIEDILNTLIHAFEQQQDRLFQSEALDVETDISVLETMMASDGLLERSKGLTLRSTSGEN